jgi:hypothetical protein
VTRAKELLGGPFPLLASGVKSVEKHMAALGVEFFVSDEIVGQPEVDPNGDAWMKTPGKYR